MLKLSKNLSKVLLKYLGASLFIFVPLYPKFPVFFIPNSNVAIRAEDFLLAISIFILLLLLLGKRTKLSSLPLLFQMSVYIFTGLLSTISAILITQTVAPNVAMFHWLRRVEYMSSFFIVYQVVHHNQRAISFYTELTILVSLGVLAYAIAQIYFSAPVISTMNKEFSKGLALTLQPGVPISSTFGGHYDLAIYLVFILSFLSSIFTHQKRLFKKLGIGAIFLAQLWLLFQTGARVPIAVSLISVPTVLFFSRKIKLIPLFIALFILTASISPYFLSRFGNILNVFKAKLTQTTQLVSPVYATGVTNELVPVLEPQKRAIQNDRSTSIRFDVEWPRALRSLHKNPFLGTGYSSITLATDNDYLRLLGETGILGFLAFISILIAIIKLFHSKLYQYPEYLGILITMLATALFLDVFEASKIAIMFWMFTALALAKK